MSRRMPWGRSSQRGRTAVELYWRRGVLMSGITPQWRKALPLRDGFLVRGWADPSGGGHYLARDVHDGRAVSRYPAPRSRSVPLRALPASCGRSTSSWGRADGYRAPASGQSPFDSPTPAAPGDDGWHINGSYHPEEQKSGPPWVNVRSRGRALLMLFLLSDTAEHDAPTCIRRREGRDDPWRSCCCQHVRGPQACRRSWPGARRATSACVTRPGARCPASPRDVPAVPGAAAALPR